MVVGGWHLLDICLFAGDRDWHWSLWEQLTLDQGRQSYVRQPTLITATTSLNQLPSITSLYNIRSLNVSCNEIKQCIWEYNVWKAVNTGHSILS